MCVDGHPHFVLGHFSSTAGIKERLQNRGDRLDRRSYPFSPVHDLDLHLRVGFSPPLLFMLGLSTHNQIKTLGIKYLNETNLLAR